MADFLKVDEALSYLELGTDMVAAEFGCGSADFSMALAKKLPMGKVYALDIQEERLSALSHNLAVSKIENICMGGCDLEMPGGSGLKNNSLDIVLIPNLLFQAENKNAILTEAERVLKSGGQLLIVDWLEKRLLGQKEGMADVAAIKQMASSLGFSLKKEFMTGDYHFAMLFIKK